MSEMTYLVRRRFYDHTKKRVMGKQTYYEVGDNYVGPYAEKYLNQGLLERAAPAIQKSKKKKE